MVLFVSVRWEIGKYSIQKITSENSTQTQGARGAEINMQFVKIKGTSSWSVYSISNIHGLYALFCKSLVYILFIYQFQNQHCPTSIHIQYPLSIRILGSTMAFLNLEHSCIVQKLEALKKELNGVSESDVNTRCVQFAFNLLNDRKNLQKNLIKLTAFGTTNFSRNDIERLLEQKNFQLDGVMRCHFLEKDNRWNFHINRKFEENEKTNYYFHPLVHSVLEKVLRTQSIFKSAAKNGRDRFVQLFASKVNKWASQLTGGSFMKTMTILSEGQHDLINFFNCLNDMELSEPDKVSSGDMKTCIYRKQLINLAFEPSCRIHFIEDLSRKYKLEGRLFDAFMWKKEACEQYISESKIADAIVILGELEIDSLIKGNSKESEIARAGLYCTRGNLATAQGDYIRARNMLSESKRLYELYIQQHCSSKRHKHDAKVVTKLLAEVDGLLGKNEYHNNPGNCSGARDHYTAALKKIVFRDKRQADLNTSADGQSTRCSDYLRSLGVISKDQNPIVCMYLSNIGTTFYRESMQGVEEVNMDLLYKAIECYNGSIAIGETIHIFISPEHAHNFYLRALAFHFCERYPEALNDAKECLGICRNLQCTEFVKETITLANAFAGKVLYTLYRADKTSQQGM